MGRFLSPNSFYVVVGAFISRRECYDLASFFAVVAGLGLVRDPTLF